MFSVFILGSCSSEKILSEGLKHKWNINYLENDDNCNSSISNYDYEKVKELPVRFVKNELKKENQNLLASNKTIIINYKKELSSLSKKVEELSLLDDDCDNIIFKNGDELSAKVIEITTDMVKYKRCDNPDGPLVSVKISELLMIRFKNGSKEVFGSKTNSKSTMKPLPHWASITGISLSALGFGLLWPFFWLGIIIGPVGILFSLIGYIQSKRNPEKYKTKSSRLLSLIGGILGLAAIVADIIWVALWW